MLVDYRIYPLGETALVVEFGSVISPEINRQVALLADYLSENKLAGIIEFIPAYTNLTIFYDPYLLSVLPIDIESEPNEAESYLKLKRIIEDIVTELDFTAAVVGRLVEIPVCYGGVYGPDIEFVAEHNGLSSAEVIAIHSEAEYLVYMIGFAPGFPYLGGMPPEIAAPRRSSPRLCIPEGSVGIAGNQTGVYPLETPGGWQLIGRTPLKLFNPSNEEKPAVLEAGCRVKFVPVTVEEYTALSREAQNND